jgi:hypothetical protein
VTDCSLAVPYEAVGPALAALLEVDETGAHLELVSFELAAHVLLLAIQRPRRVDNGLLAQLGSLEPHW